ncbi:hypothetical protein PCE1_002391 [Barthelona sp. PCE]
MTNTAHFGEKEASGLDIRVFTGVDSIHFQHAMSIRTEVFVDEQKVPIEMEHDEFDSCSTHIIILDDQSPIAAGRVYRHDDVVHMGRICVKKSRRGEGLGLRVMGKLISEGVELGPEIVLHAQVHSIPFYAKLGFVAEGDVFIEAGIDHVIMKYSETQ